MVMTTIIIVVVEFGDLISSGMGYVPRCQRDKSSMPSRRVPAQTNFFRTCRGGARKPKIIMNPFKLLRIEFTSS
jgi:hypothetical protein